MARTAIDARAERGNATGWHAGGAGRRSASARAKARGATCASVSDDVVVDEKMNG